MIKVSVLNDMTNKRKSGKITVHMVTQTNLSRNKNKNKIKNKEKKRIGTTNKIRNQTKEEKKKNESPKMINKKVQAQRHFFLKTKTARVSLCPHSQRAGQERGLWFFFSVSNSTPTASSCRDGPLHMAKGIAGNANHHRKSHRSSPSFSSPYSLLRT